MAWLNRGRGTESTDADARPVKGESRACSIPCGVHRPYKDRFLNGQVAGVIVVPVPSGLRKRSIPHKLTRPLAAIIVDEAHSSQTGEAAVALKQALGAAAVELDVSEEDFDAEAAVAAVVASRGHQPNLSFLVLTISVFLRPSLMPASA
jgi:hypothetical protein